MTATGPIGPLLALDVGTKTIGVAKCDALGLAVVPVTTLSRAGLKTDIPKVLTLVKEHRAALVVVGLPYELDGSERRSARIARQVGESLVAAGVVVEYCDERFTSVEAERSLRDAGVRPSRRAEVIDQVAAMRILESWLAERRERERAPTPGE